MKAAIVMEAGKPPVYGDFVEPVAGDAQVLVTVSYAALSPLAKGRASGTHYSSDGKVPFVVGVDGVGRLEDGRRIYFALPRAPYGSMSEKTVVRPAQCVFLPDDVDDVTAAAMGNPGMSAWAALRERAKFVAGETVLINGATGTAGHLAVQIARYMGAKKVVATGRNIDALKAAAADVAIPIGDAGDAFEAALEEQFGAGIDVVLDYLWGPSAERILVAGAKAGKDAVPIRFVQIGSVSGSDIRLPSAALRSSAIVLMGSGIGSVPMDRLIGCIQEMMEAVVPGRFEIATKVVGLSEVAAVWGAANVPRVVFRILG